MGRRIGWFLLATLWFVGTQTQMSWAVVGLDEKAPHFILPDLQGRPVDLRDLKGKVVYINFWASWCGPCKQEFPELIKLANKYREAGFVVLAVNQDKQRAGVDDFLDKYAPIAPNMTILLDPKMTVIASFGPRALPTSFVLDREGVVRYIHFGFKDTDPAAWAGEIEPLLKEM
jgi:thiol-disulfide isomerase/thioredoxin